MFITVPTFNYSRFFIDFLVGKDDHLYTHFNSKENVEVARGVYANADPQFGFLNPLYSHVKPEQDGRGYGEIPITGMKSKLNRIRRLNRAHYEKITFFGDVEGETWGEYMRRRNKAHKTSILRSYGTGDTPRQIINTFKFLDEMKDRKFVICMSLIVKDESNKGKGGGFRQHKNGPYIGSKTMRYEHFDDEGPEFKELVQYHIYEINMFAKSKVIETDNFKIYVDEDTERHTHMTVFDKEDNCACYIWREDNETPNILSVGYGGNIIFTFDKLEQDAFSKLDAKLMELHNEII